MRALTFSVNRSLGEEEGGEYHGAEHKAIFTYEAGQDLTVDNERSFPRLHPRYRASFLLIVVVVSIFVFAFVGLYPLWVAGP
ncbi:DUF1385 domain-containing protein [Desulfosporosinus lacus]|uniref:Uncharacterized protein n=1 Tax=Desulfosporosinus lacus DSM 15449 TaxID=1121420 RepID=A0A1M5R0W9_9FIRM|nr:Protein of unknown function [Desulfosporosinus lacus DSM 15449]